MKILDYLSHLFYSTTCICCEKYIGFNEVLCKECSRELVANKYYACKKCGKYRCICKELKPQFEKIAVCFEYDETSKNAVISLKKRNKISNAKPMSYFIYQSIRRSSFKNEIDMVIDVPSRFSVFQKQIFRHSELLARNVAKKLGKKYHREVLIKTKKTKKQHLTSSSEQRAKNLEGAFKINKLKNVKGKRILIVDDVLTTGNTANECAKVLKSSGAKKVFIAVFATTQQ
jgi:competence protein ComFC